MGGSMASEQGRAGVEAADLLGLGKYSGGPMLRRLARDGYIRRRGNHSRTYEISLTAAGQSAMEAWDQTSGDGLPWFPSTADAKFSALMDQLGLRYTLHSLRHFVATHLYSRNRDWVQLARFLGHSSPAITMNLYANHVIDSSQLALGEAAMDLFEDPELDVTV
jgi:integrase